MYAPTNTGDNNKQQTAHYRRATWVADLIATLARQWRVITYLSKA